MKLFWYFTLKYTENSEYIVNSNKKLLPQIELKYRLWFIELIIMVYSHSKHPLVSQRSITFRQQNKMIQKINVQQMTGFLQFPGDFYIAITGFPVARWVIMSQNYPWTGCFQCCLVNTADINYGTRYSTNWDKLVTQHLVCPIQIKGIKGFFIVKAIAPDTAKNLFCILWAAYFCHLWGFYHRIVYDLNLRDLWYYIFHYESFWWVYFFSI